MMPIERMRPEDFDAVFRLLSQSFPRNIAIKVLNL